MSFCQVIKGNDKACCNYARKNKECCYSHRSLETGYIAVKNIKIHSIQGTPEKCFYNNCKINPDKVIVSKNYTRYCCWKHTI